MLSVKNLTYTVRYKTLIQNISLEVKDGEFVGIIGPNGSGKSTLLKNIYKILKPDSGEVFLDGKSLLQMSNRQMAQKIAVVSQENNTNFDFTVSEVVQMGRYPKKKLMESANEEDQAIVRESLKMVDMEEFFDRSFLSLSGGEKQRVLIARALAQQTDMVILDEPTNHLDIGSQMKTLQLLKKSGKTVLTALHDLTFASKFCDRVYVLYQGKVYAHGNPEEVIKKEMIKKLYDVNAELFERNGKLYIDYLE